MRVARTGPSLDEALQLIVPFASTLEKLGLSYNELGGTVTPDIAAFTKLRELELSKMGLEGAWLGVTRYSVAMSSPLLVRRAQANSRSQSANSRPTAVRLSSVATRASRSRTTFARLPTRPSSTSANATSEVRSPVSPGIPSRHHRCLLIARRRTPARNRPTQGKRLQG